MVGFLKNRKAKGVGLQDLSLSRLKVLGASGFKAQGLGRLNFEFSALSFIPNGPRRACL